VAIPVRDDGGVDLEDLPVRVLSPLTGIALMALASCTTSAAYRARLDARLAEYEAHAGAPVKQIRLYTGLDRWEVLAPDRIAIFIGANRAYLLKLRGPCSGLEFQTRIGISSTNQSIDLKFDRLYFEHQVCYFAEFRPIDYRAVKRERAARSKTD